jgi:hypothetical protein
MFGREAGLDPSARCTSKTADGGGIAAVAALVFAGWLSVIAGTGNDRQPHPIVTHTPATEHVNPRRRVLAMLVIHPRLPCRCEPNSLLEFFGRDALNSTESAF